MYPLGSDKFEHEKSYPTEQRIAFYQYLFSYWKKLYGITQAQKKRIHTKVHTLLQNKLQF